jgi:hypothetical protein
MYLARKYCNARKKKRNFIEWRTEIRSGHARNRYGSSLMRYGYFCIALLRLWRSGFFGPRNIHTALRKGMSVAWYFH